MEWLDSWTGQLTGQLDWTAWTVGLYYWNSFLLNTCVFEENEMIIFKLLCFFL